ncbi:iron-containing redox enzyme family protein [Gordonia sp. HNM0687]|uniref:Iron-containing redox enzyme family protein n=1 Tax=Gordonia mangrovi TaxID=2665643 RepID=A0A6L7GLP0_9ACTN|nr:iron-containing redox enzyme family protein [Gordonia mangrovi]MXP20790.1 iron-containing redox enzyme family protein [Gordonia mangrovi]UVF78643.1 iron-containing redox enzyme family protein [Gordonia mangrovi]
MTSQLTGPTATRGSAPPLPAARGPLSTLVTEYLRADPHVPREIRTPGSVAETALSAVDPYGDDLQLALYLCYELHYVGFAGVDPAWEWHPALLAVRGELEGHFLSALHHDVPVGPGDTAAHEMDELSIESPDGDGASYHLRDAGTWDQYRQMFAVRSVFHLKEADPHAWAIPRLRGHAKAAYVAVEFDEFGGGRGEAVHQELFADLLRAAGLGDDYLGYLDIAPAAALTPVNLMSLFGLHRRYRGAAVGHLAATEITSPPGSQRLLSGLERLQAPEACRHFYREHVEADAVHEQILRTDVVGDLVRAEPDCEADVVFGIRAFLFVEDALDAHLMTAWREGRSALAGDL